ncbi:hypothetical protein [Providencia stuartii]|nr:hypothetical protein [Providencia stuartii]
MIFEANKKHTWNLGITDSRIPLHYRQALTAFGVEVIVVDE